MTTGAALPCSLARSRPADATLPTRPLRPAAFELGRSAAVDEAGGIMKKPAAGSRRWEPAVVGAQAKPGEREEILVSPQSPTPPRESG